MDIDRCTMFKIIEDEQKHHLLERYLNINKDWKDERTTTSTRPLKHAVMNSCIFVVKLLLDAGADVNDFDGVSCLHFAAGRRNEYIQMLIDAGANFDAGAFTFKRTPSHECDPM